MLEEGFQAVGEVREYAARGPAAEAQCCLVVVVAVSLESEQPSLFRPDRNELERGAHVDLREQRAAPADHEDEPDGLVDGGVGRPEFVGVNAVVDTVPARRREVLYQPDASVGSVAGAQGGWLRTRPVVDWRTVLWWCRRRLQWLP